MTVRPLLPVLLLLAGAAAAQPSADGSPGRRIDVLTGEPVRPRGTPARPSPVITNAPHAPIQPRPDDPPMQVLVAPQVGVGQAGVGQVGVGQVGVGQAGMGDIGPTGPVGLPMRPPFRRY